MGLSRKAARLSVPAVNVERFANLDRLMASLVPDQAMVQHQPPLSLDAASVRAPEERRMVHTKAWVHAASHEDSNDYLLVLCDDPAVARKCMFGTVSGLPPAQNVAYAPLKSTRDAFKAFFKSTFANELPGTSYDFYDPPLSIEFEGALYFNIAHARGSRPGPASLRPVIPTLWEIRPLTAIKFQPPA